MHNTKHQQMAMTVSSEAQSCCSDIACQDEFMLFKGLGFPVLHHKPHCNAQLFSRKDATPDSKQHPEEVREALRGVKQNVVV